MKLAWISELGYEGKINPEEPNQRVDIVWQIALQSHHYNWNTIIENPEVLHDYDAAICIIPKNRLPIIGYVLSLKKYTKIIVMQEGPYWLWQDFSAFYQSLYLETLKQIDGFFVHGNIDKTYYEGLLGRKCHILPTMINPEVFKHIPKKEKIKNSIIVGGNATSWYAGTTSASVFSDNNHIQKVFFPSMGRKIENEETLMSFVTKKDVEYFPYTNWSEFITNMSQAEYAIHLMPATAAATFNLNAAMLGIPCIGNIQADTQKQCFPELSVEVWDTTKAKQLLIKLTTDKTFYEECSNNAKERAKYFYVENQIKEVLNNIKEVINNDK